MLFRLKSFVAELHRRRVIKVAVVYFVASWLVVEISDVVFEPLRIPDWALSLVVVLVLLGFPVILVLAWVFDITSTGIQRTPAAPDTDAAAPEGGGQGILAGRREPAERSIAVLPFANMGQDQENEYFCDGLAEDVLIRLSRIKGLRVAARSSAFAFKGKNDDIRAIGERLNVATLLEGSVRKAGEKVRITVRMVNTKDGYELWSETYDRQLDDIFKVQDEISRAVFEAFRGALVSDGGEPQARKTTENMEAYNLYLMGRHQFHKRTEAALKRAVDYFHRAIEIDEGFALAYTGLADAYCLMANHTSGYGNLPLEEAIARAQPLVQKALELDDQLAEAYASLGQLRRLANDQEGSEEALRRALELNPDYPMAHVWLGLTLGNQGRMREAREEFLRAHVADPLSQIVNTNLGYAHLRFGEFEQAREKFLWVIEVDPTFPVAYSGMAQLEGNLGNLEEALKWRKRAIAIAPTRSYYHCLLSELYMEMGNFESAERAVADAERLTPDNPTVIESKIALYVARGEHRELLEYVNACLEKTPEEKRAMANAGLACLLNGNPRKAREHYSKIAPDLAEWLNDSAVWRWDYPHALNFANALALTREKRKADSLLSEYLATVTALDEQGIANPEISYLYAEIFTLQQRNGDALEALQKAIDKGWRRGWWAMQDPNLASLRNDPEFAQTVKRVLPTASAKIE